MQTSNKLLVLHARQQDQAHEPGEVFPSAADTFYDPTLSLANIKLVKKVLVKIGAISNKLSSAYRLWKLI